MTGFATAQERDILEELFALKRAAHQVEGEEGPTLKARIERLIGTRFWEIADDLPARRWALQREVQGIERELTDLDQRLRVVAEAESTYVATVIPRLENFRRRSESLLATINTAMGAREQQIATLLRNRLRDETEQIGQYLFFTRVAIAEVSDQLIAADGLAAGQEEAP
jgi:flagellar motility protein MotE (MotC chaperone)